VRHEHLSGNLKKKRPSYHVDWLPTRRSRTTKPKSWDLGF